MTVSVDSLVKRFGAFAALNEVSLDVRPGEFLALLGPSGSGKTTLLRVIGGLDFPDSGSIAFDGVDVGNRPARERKVGFVFQHYALFRHMSVADNIGFGLTVKPRRERPAAKDIAARVEELLTLIQLPGMGKRFPAQLSGGQRQRVALARALAVEPSVLLLDEPFGALDAKVRNDLRRWLRGVHETMGLTSIFVTHDQDEALDLADRVAVMNAGRIEQVDTPDAVYNRPTTAFVADFIGNANRFDCSLDGGAVVIGELRLANTAPTAPDGRGVAFVRPHEFEIATARTDGIAATVRRIARTGALAAIECVAAGKTVEVALDVVPVGLAPGDAVSLVPTTVRAYPE
ncbi:sulfate/molybdate ABC transporter ATP-binding protein [Polymorphobacter sp. PAMC 29334]|uniref:sulfate/molybdate ABC transporter ATP-binding protein n=1 Tax=Polymorphobacter sp. PAMC 29334 TaxID=2862331 RepID=UPI001C67AEA0|nr:sulfate/molybdate ABC transporter ATP-binding protein [Polymorphobacter sp. PAMC 29334]QYE35577.1 sulfate/molybdate ABC transporter ATP-binding protein [Polymorphobacter sp. PAMC 29334]